MHTRGNGLKLAGRRLKAKQQTIEKTRLTFVSPSNWLAGVARRSPAAAGSNIVVIPNGLDLERFKPIDKAAARALFCLPTDKTILLFGAVKSDSDPRKGFAQLDEMLRHAAASPLAKSLVLCVYGTASKSDGEMHGVSVRYVGHLHDDESLIALYSAADIFVAPSLQDNLPNTVVEASACGLPTIAFNIGGMPDLIDDGVTGFLVRDVKAEALFAALQRALGQPGWLAQASDAARRLAEDRFCSRKFASAHIETYQDVIRRRSAFAA
jgi:glycosyltransferase involved in cell wall biosynthesis